MSKVLVMTEEQASSRIQGYKDTLEMEIALGTYDAEEIGAMKFRLAAVQSFRAAMTTIDIPDGCKLAVVELESVMVNMPSVGPVEEHRVRRIVQEVM